MDERATKGDWRVLSDSIDCAEPMQDVDSESAEALTANFVARETMLFQEDHIQTGARQERRSN
jgi:hypothetical protein